VENTEKLTWEKTKVQFLLRNSQSGIYYVRGYAHGKELWKSLKTDVFSVAKARMGDVLEGLRKVDKAVSTVLAGRASVENAATVYLDDVRQRVDIKPATKRYWEQIVAALLASWPELGAMKINKVTARDCQAWAANYAKEASPTRYNNTVDCLRAIFGIGLKHGLLFRNPAAELGKLRVRSKHLELPSPDQFRALVKAIRGAGAWCSRQCGDLIEFLAFSGCRLDEAAWITWPDVHEAEGFIWVHGDPVDSTKNSERRQVPIIPAMARLLKDLRKTPRAVRDPKREGKNFVLAITEAQKALDRWCPELGIKRITHHDLRHLFATAAIESGIDIPTVSKWLGHKDGGALAMKTYGHLRRDHFRAAAKKVRF
jgi:integrase